ncbi:MAG: HIT family protein [Bdellovibrionales bacterium]
MSTCRLCEKVITFLRERPAQLIAEFESSILIVGDHQFFPGYVVLIHKEHHREMHDLKPEMQNRLWQDLMRAGQSVAKTYQPWKMNYASLGNQDPHLHWHIFPRYESDPNHREHPWTDAVLFAAHTTTPEQAQDVAQRLRHSLGLPAVP